MIRTQYEDKVIEALARLRQVAADGKIGMFSQIAADLDALDNAGVFSDLDEQTDYAPAVEILAEAALKAAAESRDDFEHPADPAEWGDTDRADMARHQSYVPALERLRTISYTSHEHVFPDPHSDTLCLGSDDCLLTYGEYRDGKR